MLADFGATVILACRDLKKAEAAAAEIRQCLFVSSDHRASPPTHSAHAVVSCAELDLTSFASVRSFAKSFLDSGQRLDVLYDISTSTVLLIPQRVCNAGVITPSRQVTNDGYELMFQVRDFETAA